ncbi:jg5403 [Pararge aegeria aegeria]|uniref:Jg5403 protein n=1 Tax=Pararge aegeria aegeria TaxID=348720 RepID=A0A8S4S704_9NEOP|nr:jg5403 [Pararge aegeria aegeria]
MKMRRRKVAARERDAARAMRCIDSWEVACLLSATDAGILLCARVLPLQLRDSLSFVGNSAASTDLGVCLSDRTRNDLVHSSLHILRE